MTFEIAYDPCYNDHVLSSKCDIHLVLEKLLLLSTMVSNHKIYTTKGRDRFHWAATPLKPCNVGNICFMTYSYSVLYFLNLSLKHFFSHRKRNFLWNIQIRRPFPCFNAFAHAQSTYFPIEDRRYCTLYKCISFIQETHWHKRQRTAATLFVPSEEICKSVLCNKHI